MYCVQKWIKCQEFHCQLKILLSSKTMSFQQLALQVQKSSVKYKDFVPQSFLGSIHLLMLSLKLSSYYACLVMVPFKAALPMNAFFVASLRFNSTNLGHTFKIAQYWHAINPRCTCMRGQIPWHQYICRKWHQQSVWPWFAFNGTISL